MLRSLLILCMTLSAAAGAARAEESAGLLKWLMQRSKLATETPEPQDFVKATRPDRDSLRYIDIGEKRPQRALKPLDKGGVKGRESSFDGLKARNDRLLAGKPAPRPGPTLPPAALKAKAEHEAALKARARANN
ncbi:MAG: hypothetical protein JNK46_13885 [Methylobacteriaceae bacterium]|nr:hypothetical protein [Methylobacteriaceae bacterium]